MAVKELSELIAGLSPEEQHQLVALISHNLTVVARNYTQELDTHDAIINIIELRVLNEMQHQLSGCLLKTFGEYPVIDLIRCIRVQAEKGDLISQTDWAIERATARYSKVNDPQPPSSMQ